MSLDKLYFTRIRANTHKNTPQTDQRAIQNCLYNTTTREMRNTILVVQNTDLECVHYDLDSTVPPPKSRVTYVVFTIHEPKISYNTSTGNMSNTYSLVC